MHELGNLQYAAPDMGALNTLRKELTGLIQKTAQIKIADDDAAAAVIRNTRHTKDIQQDNQNAKAQFSASRPTETGPRTKEIMASSESSKYHVYSDPGELQIKLTKEIEAINSFDGFMLGVHDKIEKFSRHTEFGLEQVLDVEHRIAELHDTLELYKFTLKRIKAEALKALRCQGNLGPQRVLRLLKERIAKQNAAGQATVPV